MALTFDRGDTSVDTGCFYAPYVPQVKWTAEAALDMEQQHELNLEDEIARVLTQEIARESAASWADVKAALLEDLGVKQPIVDQLLANQRASLVEEYKPTSEADFKKVMLPMIRRIIPGLITEELVGVQPMSEPRGLVFSLRYKYSEEKVELDESLTDKLKGWARAGRFGIHRPPVQVGKPVHSWPGRDSDGGHREIPKLAFGKFRAPQST